MSTTPLMVLDLPVVGPSGTAGPDWATKLNAALTLVDSHDHTTNKGTRVPSAGLNINADLSFAGFNATSLKSSRYSSQSAALASSSDKSCVYVVSGDLYYNNSSGTAIQITAGSGINLSSVGSIGGDFSTSTASVIYTDATKTFTFKQDATKTADMAFGSISIYEDVTSGHYVKFQTTTGLAADYTCTLPTALPASTLPLVSTSGGVMSFTNITQAMRAAMPTGTTAAAGEMAISNSTGTFTKTTTTEEAITNLSVTITTTGRPVILFCIGASASNSFFSLQPTGGSGQMTALLFVRRDSTNIANISVSIEQSSTGVTFKYPPSTVYHVDAVAAGTYTYTIRVATASSLSSQTFNAEQIKLVAYEV